MILKFNSINKKAAKNFCKIPCSFPKLPRFIPNNKNTWQSTELIRSRFIEYFIKHNHSFVEPSSLFSKNIGSYFINSGVSQFKEHILGYDSIFSGINKAVNSQRCIRLGGKKCDLNNIGYDSSHLSYFEMLGNWSFGSYNKQNACKLMWRFLTEELELPSSHLYVTYFGGSEKLGLPPDDETRDIWFNLGLKDSKILQFGEEHNFWEMGDCSTNSLCGPSTEIHWDYLATLTDSNDPRCARCFVNSNSSEVAELWNCVFMEYKWIGGGTSLTKLPALIIDTGMGLERLSSIIQGVSGVYDIDSFKYIMDHLCGLSKSAQYQGTFNLNKESPISQRLQVATEETKFINHNLRIDTAYRVISDHLRAVTVCMNDGIQPGRQGRELKIRQLLQRAIRQARFGLGMTGGLSPVIDTVCESLRGCLNIDSGVRDKLKRLINKEEKTFFPRLDAYERSFNHFLSSRDSEKKKIDKNEVNLLLGGKFGDAISLDMIRVMSRDADLIFSDDVLFNDDYVVSFMDKSKSSLITDLLINRNIIITNNATVYNYEYNEDLNIYEVPDLETTVDALLIMSPTDNRLALDISSIHGHITEFGLVTKQTNMYAAKGGQDSDKGYILSKLDKRPIGTVNSVTVLDTGHIIHWCFLNSSTATIQTTDEIILQVDNIQRTGNTLHHTAHHMIFAALNNLLGRVNQTSSYVKVDQAKIGFSIDSSFGNAKILLNTNFLEELESFCLNIIKEKMSVEIKENVNFAKISQEPHVRYLQSDRLPSEVRVVSIGNTSEICCGTHAFNTAHLRDIIITSLKRTNQALIELSFLVGKNAIKIRKRDNELKNICQKLDQMGIDNREGIDKITLELNKALGGNVMSKLTREIIAKSVNTAQKCIIETSSISELLKPVLSSHNYELNDVPIIKIDRLSNKKAVKTISELSVPFSIIMYDNEKILIYCAQKTLRDVICRDLPVCHEGDLDNISDMIIKSPNVRNVDNESLNQFISISLPEHYQAADKFVINLKNLIKEHS